MNEQRFGVRTDHGVITYAYLSDAISARDRIKRSGETAPKIVWRETIASNWQVHPVDQQEEADHA